MRSQLKLGLYVVTALGTLVFGLLFIQAWKRAGAPAPAPKPTLAATPSPAPAGPNPTEPSPPASSESPTPDPAASTNTPSPVDPAAETTPPSDPTPEREAVPLQTAGRLEGTGLGRTILWGLLAVASLIGLVGLGAYDFSTYAGQRATETLFDDQGDDVHETLYEQVENAYASGQFLDAIQLLRDFLKENPRGIHAQIRIAEIYEKDLNNPVAAVLEYEEVLQHALDPERRGWTAIHLVNLYNRLGRTQPALDLLQRIVVECPDTPAAAKARERLDSLGIDTRSEPPPPPTDDPGASSEPPSGLPKGFRPR